LQLPSNPLAILSTKLLSAQSKVLSFSVSFMLQKKLNYIELFLELGPCPFLPLADTCRMYKLEKKIDWEGRA
jgi:hypothetical protein